MKQELREPYRVVAAEIDWSLCGFCRHYQCWGSACDGDGGECTHPIETLAEHPYGMPPEEDCWGFRPSVNISTAADIVGLALANNYDPERMYWMRIGKNIKVFAKKRKLAESNRGG